MGQCHAGDAGGDRAHSLRHPRAILPLLLAFVAGAAGLGLELVAGRVAALNVGVSLYSWTGVIGATLAGLAAGAWGGRRVEAGRLGALLGGTAAYAVVAVAVLSAWPVVEALEAVPRMGRLVVVLVLVGFLPAVALGGVVPVLARAVVGERVTAGVAAGRLLAVSTLGSLVGALAAGAWLVPAVGVRGTAVAFGVALLAVPAPGSSAWDRGLRPRTPGVNKRDEYAEGQSPRTPRRAASATLVAPVLLVAAAVVAAVLPHACDAESAYQCVRVAEEESFEGRPVKVLYLDGLPHAHVDLADPLELVHEYLVPAAELAHYQAATRVLVIGGGGYSLPRRIAAALPEARIDVLELDPEVTRIARAELGLPDEPPFAIHHGDARQTLRTLDGGPYDLVVLDAFSDVVVPYHLVTDGFDRELRARMAPTGVYAALVHDRGSDGRLLPAVARTMRAVFGRVDVLAAGPGVRWDSPRSRTWTVVGSAQGLDGARLRATRRLTRAGEFPVLSERMPEGEMVELLEREGPAVLTDDYAPVEMLAAPLFR